MAEDRKARLAALKARAGRSRATSSNNDDDQNQPQDDDVKNNEEPKSLHFRNYTPKDKLLDPATATTAKHGADPSSELEGPSSKRMKTNATPTDPKDDPSTSKVSTASELEKALVRAKVEAALAVKESTSTTPSSNKDATVNDNATSMAIAAAPKKINWDLKRDVAKKLHRLERRTQKAVVELLKERLEREAEAQEDDLD